MVKAFVSNVDSPFGHNVSRLLTSTIVGSRRPEEEPEEDEEENEDKPKPEAPPKEPYVVVGTMLPPRASANRVVSEPGPMVETGNRKKDNARREAIEKYAVAGRTPKWVSETVMPGDRTTLRDTLLDCDVIIYDLVQSLDEASWAIETLSEMADQFANKPKTFIAVSTIMTWARTKGDPDDPDAYITEDEYRRRKPHPNFKQHLAIEKNIIKHGKKSALRTYVIAPGLVYHPGDCIFHYLFKAAWHNEEELICYGDGSNVAPTIHLDDLCNIIVETVETLPETKYLLAIDDGKYSLYELTKAISEALGTGKVKKVPKEAALLNRDLPQSDFDMLMVNVRLEPGHVKDMSFEWKFEAGLIESITQLIQEYKDARGLTPLRIIVHGPPAVGKTFCSERLAKHYEIHLVEVEKVVQDAVARLERRAAGILGPDEQDDDIDADRDLLEELKEAARANNGKYPDEHIINFVRDKLRSMPCRNQGYVLDGYPNVTDEAKELYKSDNDDDGKDEKLIPSIDHSIAPDHIISLEASDDFIKDRIMKLPESAIAGTRNSEEALVRRLEEFRTANTEENTVLNFFDEQEIHPLSISVETTDTDKLMDLIIKHVGKPHNYGPTAEQLAEERRVADEAKTKELAQAEEEQQRREKEEGEKHAKSVQEWNSRLEEIRKQEQEVLEAQSVPLRNYLMRYVMPTLTSGLIEVCKVRPEDPIDHLAEFLFKHNPGNM
ncbi:Adenylate kinase 7 [Rhizophlyctis rosea]|uniref:Adenylate kinase 7 n=1 Tax=Rhizophlyctis rosea TaxID=64517 RepID=A0AAD5SFP1_9FUNG|nr:Adenylate kinase 7 [Rhizophlyctis rosea]